MKRKSLLFLAIMLAGAVWAQGPNKSGTYYYNANGLTGANLKTALFKIINTHRKIGYDGLFDAYKKTDKKPNGKLRDWYSNATNYDFDEHSGYRKEGDCYNREHSVPQSWFKGSASEGNLKCDVVHVLPTDGYVNNMRSAYPFGEVVVYEDDANKPKIYYESAKAYSRRGPCRTEGYSGTVFEPNDEIKGDIARIYFYMVTCYESEAGGWGNSVFSKSNLGFEKWVLDMLMRWSKQDPVSEIETARNDSVYLESVQHNRNPFVDYPGLEDYIWGDKVGQQVSYDNYEGSGSGTVVPTVAMPVFSPDAGTYYDQVEVSIRSATADAAIYYTTDGSVPTENSTRYEQPFLLTETATVKAIAVLADPASEQSAVSYQAEATYWIKSSQAGDDDEEETPVDGEIMVNDDLFNTSYAGAMKTSDSENLKATKSGITIEYALGTGSNRYCSENQIRLYPGNTLTISVAQGSIEELEFFFASGTPSTSLEVEALQAPQTSKAKAAVPTAVETLTDGKWAGNAQSITIGLASGKHARISGVKVKTSVPTGIDGISATSNARGRRVIYTLQGQRVVNPSRGIYIVDGKKVVIP